MILPFPYRPEDWLSIWQATKTMTLLTVDRDSITIAIASATVFEQDDEGNLESVKVEVSDGVFYISFGDLPESLRNQLTFQINCRDPKKGEWHIPKWYIDKCREAAEDTP